MTATTLALAVGGAAYALSNLVAWAAFRLDKRKARRGLRRTPERTLLWLTAFGGAGALVAMYAHRQRHKVDKRGFRGRVWALVALQVSALGGLGVLLARG